MDGVAAGSVWGHQGKHDCCRENVSGQNVECEEWPVALHVCWYVVLCFFFLFFLFFLITGAVASKVSVTSRSRQTQLLLIKHTYSAFTDWYPS